MFNVFEEIRVPRSFKLPSPYHQIVDFLNFQKKLTKNIPRAIPRLWPRFSPKRGLLRKKPIPPFWCVFERRIDWCIHFSKSMKFEACMTKKVSRPRDTDSIWKDYRKGNRSFKVIWASTVAIPAFFQCALTREHYALFGRALSSAYFFFTRLPWSYRRDNLHADFSRSNRRPGLKNSYRTVELSSGTILQVRTTRVYGSIATVRNSFQNCEV